MPATLRGTSLLMAKRFVFLRYRREVFHQTFRAEQVALFVEKIDGPDCGSLRLTDLHFRTS